MNGSAKPVLEINLASVRTKKQAHTLETVKHQYNTNITDLLACTVTRYGTQSHYALPCPSVPPAK